VRPQRPRSLSCGLLGVVLTAAMLTGAIPREAFAQGSSLLRSKGVDVDTLLAKAGGPTGVRVMVTLRGATSGTQSLPLGSSSTQPPASPAPSGQLTDGLVPTIEQAQLLARHGGTEEAKRQRWAPRLIPNTPYVAMTVTRDELEALAADGDVVSLHEDGQLRPGLQDSVPLIGMAAVYARGGTGANTLVAILDTGVEYFHVFTNPRVTNATCFSTNSGTFASLCPNGQSSQIGTTAGFNCDFPGCEHGTHVAGIAAGNRPSGTPLNGVAKSADIFAGQVFSRRLADNALIAFDSDILSSLNDFLGRVNAGEFNPRKVAAINLSIWDVSFQVPGNCDANARAVPFKSVIDGLRAAGVATVIMAGNNAQTNLSAFPGCVSTAITVSATTKADAVSSFSNLSSIVDVLAPGESITSSVNPTPNFGAMSGTSMAAAHVTGAIAAIRSACPNATLGDIEALLTTTGTAITDTRPGGTLVKPRLRVDVAVQQCGFRIRDFNGDGKSDILWRHTAGDLALWLMNGGAVASTGILGNVATSWTIDKIGDFNGDGKADILWRNTSGTLSIWLMNGLAVASTNILGNVAAAWTTAGVGDFNGDGTRDILWRHTAGDLALWLINGGAVASTSVLGNVATSWTIVGVADFNGDGKADILWRDTSGTLALWLMNGFTVASTSILGNVATAWTVAGVGDFNGDGKSDILWRHTSGDTALWFMNGGAVASTSVLGNVATVWTIDKIGDFNGDGKADILWRDTSGTLALWLMNGAAVASTSNLGNVATSWVTQVGASP
jgi:hypothetical protein